MAPSVGVGAQERCDMPYRQQGREPDMKDHTMREEEIIRQKKQTMCGHIILFTLVTLATSIMGVVLGSLGLEGIGATLGIVGGLLSITCGALTFKVRFGD